MQLLKPLARVGAVSYLNTVPLVWGMLHGAQSTEIDLSFSIPSVCAARVEDGTIDVGLVPVAEIARQQLQIISDVGIAAVGAVRSILLVSRVPIRQIRRVAVDSSSRTSVQLLRVILRERYGVEPELLPTAPRLPEMLEKADAALVIGDPALQINLEDLPFEHLDLSHEWQLLTGLPMVFAAWAAKADFEGAAFRRVARASYNFGATQLDEIAEDQYRLRGVSKSLASEYIGSYIHYVLGPQEMKGLDAFFELAALREAGSLTL